MDITAVLTASVPAEGAPAAVPKDLGDTFAGLLATAMVDLPSSPEPPVCPIPDALPVCPTPVNAEPLVVPEPPVCPTPVSASTPTLGKAEDAPPPTSGSESLTISDPTDPIKADPNETVPERGSKPSTAIRGRPRVLAPPRPPPAAQAPATPEKEAPTNAPNAPVAPLDRSSETELAPEAVVPAAPPSLAAVTAVLSTASPQPTVATVPAPVVRQAKGPVTVRAAAIDATVPVAAPLAGPLLPKPPTTTEAVVGAAPRKENPTLLEAPEAPEIAGPSTVETDPTAPPVEDAPNAPVQKLQAAPDLGVVPQVILAAPIVETPRPVEPKAVVNAQIAPVAAQAKPAAVEKPALEVETTTVEAVVAETAPKEREAGTGDGDARDPSPSPQAPPTVKAVAIDRPEAGTDRPAVDRHLVVRQVADRIESLVASRPRDGVTIHLEPRDLGTVTLVVRGIASALDVQVSASDERVRSRIEAFRPELAQALAPRGIEIRELRVAASSAASSNTANPNGGNPNPNPEGRPRPQSAPTYARPKAAEEASPRPFRARGRGVDLLA